MREQDAIMRGENEQPIPPDLYGERLTDVINEQYEKAVGTATKRTAHTLIKFFKHESKTTECQTLSYDEFEAIFQAKIDQLEQMLSNRKEEQKIVEKDIHRLREQCEILSYERSAKIAELEHLEQKYFLTKGQFDAKEREIEDLKRENRRQHRQIEQLDYLSTEQKRELDTLQEEHATVSKDHKRLQKEQHSIRTDLTNETNMRKALEHKCRD